VKLYGAENPAPNPRRVRIFLAEKGAHIEEVPLALRERAHKAPAFLQINSLGQVPVLELDDGSHLCESVSICRYLDEVLPGPKLFGADAQARAGVDMWIRRIEFQVMMPIAQIWRHTHPYTAALHHQYTEFGESNRAHSERAYRWLDAELGDSAFIAGDYSMADIVALSTVDFGRHIGAPIPDDCVNVTRWWAGVSARQSAAA
jgi:glutathione S-transferase